MFYFSQKGLNLSSSHWHICSELNLYQRNTILGYGTAALGFIWSWFCNCSGQKCYWKPKKYELDCKLQELSQHEAWQMLHLLVRSRSMVFSVTNTMFWHHIMLFPYSQQQAAVAESYNVFYCALFTTALYAKTLYILHEMFIHCKNLRKKYFKTKIISQIPYLSHNFPVWTQKGKIIYFSV